MAYTQNLVRTPRILAEDEETRKRYIERLEEEIIRLYERLKKLYRFDEAKIKLEIVHPTDTSPGCIYVYYDDKKELFSSNFGLFYLYGLMRFLVDIKERKSIRIDTYAKELRESLISLASEVGYGILYNDKRTLKKSLSSMVEKTAIKLPFIKLVEKETVRYAILQEETCSDVLVELKFFTA